MKFTRNPKLGRGPTSETIGSVTIFLGDATDIVPTLEFDSVVTDPPYGMEFRSDYRAERYDALKGDHDPELLRWACTIKPVRHSTYVWGRWDNLVDVPRPKSLITWVKNNWGMGDLKHAHARQTEVLFFYPGAEHAWPAKRPTDVIHGKRTKYEHHPTEKPVDVMEQVIGWTSGTIVDPFMGAGATLLAAMRTGRRAYGVEINETHYATARRRLLEAAGG